MKEVKITSVTPCVLVQEELLEVKILATTPQLEHLTITVRRANAWDEEATTPTLVMICVIDQHCILNALDDEGHVGKS